jgi:N-acetylmuramoyl-L-alanine amidase
VAALHRPESRKEVLDDPGYYVADVGLVVGRRRTLEKDEVLSAAGLLQALLEDPILPPLTQDLQFECGEWIA